MTRNIFGWSLPPGCTTLPGESAEEQRTESLYDKVYEILYPYLAEPPDGLVEAIKNLVSEGYSEGYASGMADEQYAQTVVRRDDE